MEKLWENQGTLRRRAEQTLDRLWEKPRVRLAVRCSARLILGLLLARGRFFGYAAPFGLAYAAAAGLRPEGFAAMAGAMVGYFSMGEVTGTLLLAAALLVFAVKLILMNRPWGQSAWIMPLTAAAAFCTALLPYIITRGWPQEMVFYFYAGAGLAGGCTCLYAHAGRIRGRFLSETDFKSEVGLLALLVAGLAALADVRLPTGISAGKTAAQILVLLAAREAGPGWGTAAGLTAGMTIDIALNQSPLYCAIYGFAGFLGGICFKKGKTAGTAAFLLAAAACGLWAWNTPCRLTVYYETFAATVLYMLLPDMELPRVLLLTDGGESSMGVLYRSRYRLECTARAFRDMVEWLNKSFVGQRSTDNFNLFARVADKVCRRCKSAPRCWGSDSETTRSALNAALPAMLESGVAEEQQFPTYFRSACKNMEKFLEESRRQLHLVLEARHRSAGQRESDRLLCRQYSDLARVLADCARQMPLQLQFDLKLERRINRAFSDRGIKCRSTAFTGEQGRLRIELETAPDASAEELLMILQAVTGKRLLREESRNEDSRFCFREAEIYKVIVGAAAGKKPGETVSGDSATYFKTEEGFLYALLADGMGSGESAAKESHMALEVLERFLRAGVSAEVALRTLDAAWMLKSRETGVFSTVDVLRVNLFTGQAVIFKYGAAPSYLKRDGTVKRLAADSLPIGTGELRANPAQSRFTLHPGDMVVMLSDGIREEDSDEWLTGLLEVDQSKSPRELAAAITAAGIAGREPSDDMTVCVFKLEEQA